MSNVRHSAPGREASSEARREARSPYFNELVRGHVFQDAPAVTLTDGLQAQHLAILGSRQRVVLDQHLGRAATGTQVASPSLVCDVAIGQSTTATQHVRANLFYRGLSFHRHPGIGDTLTTTTEVEALRTNKRREDRPDTGLAVLRIRTVDQDDRTVLDFRRCAMILVAPGAIADVHDDDIDGVALRQPIGADSLRDWDLRALHASAGTSQLQAGETITVVGGDVVSSAPELARLTGNLARVHHDAEAGGGQRLVYGGHTIGLAYHHLTRAVPGLVTVLGWTSCDHLAPVHEGDVLASTVEVVDVRRESISNGDVAVADLRIRTSRSNGDAATVLDWKVTVAVA